MRVCVQFHDRVMIQEKSINLDKQGNIGGLRTYEKLVKRSVYFP